MESSPVGRHSHFFVEPFRFSYAVFFDGRSLSRIRLFAIRRRLFGLEILTAGVGPREVEGFLGVPRDPGVFFRLQAISPDVLRLRWSHTTLSEMPTVNARLVHEIDPFY